MGITYNFYFMKSPLAYITASVLDQNLLYGGDDDLPVHVSHYHIDLGPEGGQGVMRVSIDLSLNFAPHEIL
jgi:hypothetical protein